MTEQEHRVLSTLAGMKERIECGAFRIVSAQINETIKEPLSMSLNGSIFETKIEMTLDFEIIKVAMRVPLTQEIAGGI